MKESIEEKIEGIVNDVLDMDPMNPNFNPGELEYRERQFRVGSQFMRDKNMNERIKTGQMIRIVGMVTSDPETREQYIKATTPGMIPDLKNRPE
jgi:hypothetical protein